MKRGALEIRSGYMLKIKTFCLKNFLQKMYPLAITDFEEGRMSLFVLIMEINGRLL